MPKWTKDQDLAIKDDGSNIIVSAGAGSGKTAVLTERVITKLLNGVDINRLLVLTFTNPAAAEMKDRIRKAIIDNKLYDQLDYLDSSYITTFDSYAQSIVKKYHYLLNIPSSLKIVDDTVISIEIVKIVDEIFEEYYGNPAFDKFICSYCTKSDTMLKKVIIDLNEKLDLKSDKEGFLDSYIDKYYDDSYLDILVDEYIEPIIDKIKELRELYLDIKGYLNEDQYEKIGLFLGKLLYVDDYDEVINLEEVRAPGFKNLDEEAVILYDKIKAIRKYIKDLPKYSKSELKNNVLLTKDNVSVIITLIKELSSRITKYKLDNNSYTFTDVAKMAIKIVKDNEEVREELKNYYNEIMVDEYQDTSDLQEEFISLIGNNNIYMVGDIKQSIYRFRHANPEIFRSKYNNYSVCNGGKKIDLLQNFRSREEVLANINTIFDPIMDEKIGNAAYSVSHRMVHGNTMYDLRYNTDYNMDILNYELEDKKYSPTEVEAFIIAKDIKEKVESKYQVIDKESKQLRDCNYGDFCIIMDRGSAFDTYSKILEYSGIPSIVWHDETLNVEDDIAILKNIVNLIIKIKDGIDQEFKYYFTSIARSYLFNYSDSKILKIFKDNTFKEDEIYKIAYNISLDIDSITNNMLLERIIKDFNLYEKTILNGNIESSMVRYNIFSNLFSSLSDLGYTPYDLPLYFKNSSKLDIRYSLSTKIPGSVNIMNIHKSKGLEFSICYFSGLAKKFNDQDIKTSFLFDDKYGIIIPFNNEGIGNTILRDLYVNKYYLEDISEKIRLFYVGLTRAKEKMIIVCPKYDNEEVYTDIVNDDVRLKYRSIYDMLNSISDRLKPYSKDIDVNNIGLTKSYNLSKKGNKLPNIFSEDKKIELSEINIINDEEVDSHFSKVSNVIHTREEISSMEYGTFMHELFETTDFYNPDTTNSKVLKFISKLNLNDVKIYKEFEFIYEEDNTRKHGIIDLMLEYNDHIDIIDYKLKNTLDPNYVNQVNGYKKYISNKTGKMVNTYLYSILNEEFKQIV